MNNMGDNSRSGWLRTNAPVFSGVGTVALALIGLAGLYFLVGELKELHRQNSLIESRLTQTYRPIGFACCSPDELELVVVEILSTEEKLDKFSFQISYYLYNHGQGVLSYIGCFFMAYPEPVEFRTRLLNGDIDSVNVDSRYSFVRRETVLPYAQSSASRTSAPVRFLDVPYAEKYFAYTLFLYEDQEGNLYDTEHLNVLPFEKPKVEGELVVPKLDKKKPAPSRETYHCYLREERGKLVAAIRALRYPEDHQIADFIEGLK
ncbi:MAG: hypothetical protein WBF13_14265 [Candidatus Zixiibacteriota bacterium]